MKNTMLSSLAAVAVFMLAATVLNAQSLLDDDTLFIGSATGAANEQVVVPVFLSTTHYVQGWQIPIRFGGGFTPAYCDSVSTVGTVMQDWVFKAPLVNNNEWNNVQTCGIAGLKDWTGGSISPGYHHVMDLCFSIDGSPQSGVYVLDTTRASWYQGGPVNAFVITVGNVSYITHVVPGELTITPVGINEETADRTYDVQVYPTVARIGEQITVHHGSCDPVEVVLYDGTGRIVARFAGGNTCPTQGLQPGVYFVTTERSGIQKAKKIVLY